MKSRDAQDPVQTYRIPIQEESIDQYPLDLLALLGELRLHLLEARSPPLKGLFVHGNALLLVQVVVAEVAVGDRPCLLDVHQLLRHLRPEDGTRSVIPVRNAMHGVNRYLLFGLRRASRSVSSGSTDKEDKPTGAKSCPSNAVLLFQYKQRSSKVPHPHPDGQ